jgi:hypothetical protein
MKPTPETTHQHQVVRHNNRTGRKHARFPSTDYNYHPPAKKQVSFSAARPATKSPAFHKLSSEFFGAESSWDYVAELFFFILITGIAAWPIMFMLIAVTRLIRNY